MQTSLKIVLAVMLFVSFSCGSTAKNATLHTKKITVHSMLVKDSFEIYTTLPSGYAGSAKSFPIILYMDANLKSGNNLRNIIDDLDRHGKSVNAVFVGVGHIGNYHLLRRRDFITPFIKDKNDSLFSNDTNYGQCEAFYLFLKDELIPYIEKNYKVNSNRTLIGHSLGGLFVFYCLFKNERPFTNFVALSPALWINRANIYGFEKKYRRDSASLHANLYLCVGGAERFNYILSGSKMMRDYLENNRYGGLHFEYHELAGETHNSEVPVALRLILRALKLD